MRVLTSVIVLAAVIGFGWVFSLPSKAECVASGRIVDPTERHCQDPTGYQQLEEHALFHSTQVVMGAAVLLGAGYAVFRFRRRRSVTPVAT
jgi:hypothetical protein